MNYPKQNASGYFYVKKITKPTMYYNSKLPKYLAKVYNSNTSAQKKKYFDNERKAALWVDKQLIAMGREPVNILKRI